MTAPPSQLAGWVVIDDPVAGPSAPARQFNSSGGSNTFLRTGIGTYTIRFGGLASQPDPAVPGSAGVAHVTPFGRVPARCALKSYAPNDGDEVVQVRCVEIGSDAMVDVPVSVTFSRARAKQDAAFRGFVLANRPAMDGAYRPSVENSLNLISGGAGARPIIEHRAGAPGRYFVTFPGALLGRRDAGQVVITPIGSGLNSCVLGPSSLASPDPVIGVRCFNTNGDLQNGQFVLSFVSRAPLAPSVSGTYGYHLNGTPTQSPAYNWAATTSYAGRVFHTTDTAAPDALAVLVPGAASDASPGAVHVVAYESSEFRQCQPTSWRTQLSDVVIKIACVDSNGRPAYYIGNHVPQPAAVSYQSEKGL